MRPTVPRDDAHLIELLIRSINQPHIQRNIQRQKQMAILQAPENTNSNFVKFTNIGDTVKGLYVSYAVVDGQFGEKPELVLRTKEGPKTITCSTHLKQILDAHEDAIKGKVITITLKNLKAVGKGNPMKIFEVEVTDPKAAPPPAQAPDEELPF